MVLFVSNFLETTINFFAMPRFAGNVLRTLLIERISSSGGDLRLLLDGGPRLGLIVALLMVSSSGPTDRCLSGSGTTNS